MTYRYRHEGGGLWHPRMGSFSGPVYGDPPWSVEFPVRWPSYPGYDNALFYGQGYYSQVGRSLEYPGTVVAETAGGNTTGNYYASGPFAIGYGVNHLPLPGSRDDPAGSPVPGGNSGRAAALLARAESHSEMAEVMAAIQRRAGGFRQLSP